MERIIFASLLVVASMPGQAQTAPAIEWQRNLGGSMIDVGSSIAQTSDGGFILCGHTTSNNGDVSGNHSAMEDIWVVKLDANGATEWQRCLGGTQAEIGQAALQTPDGGYMVLGSTSSNNGDVSGNHGMFDIWLVKLNAEGEPTWQRCYGGSLNDAPFDMKPTPDGGYIIAGESRSSDGDLTANAGFLDYWVLKIDADGEIQWQRSYGGSSDEFAVAIALTSDGGYIVNGLSNSTDGDVIGAHGNDDYWVVKIDAAGEIQWQRPCGGSNFELAYAITEMSDGSYMAVGLSSSQDGDVTEPLGWNDLWAIRLSALGEVIEDRSYGGSERETGTGLLETPDGGLVYCGSTRSNDGDVPANQGLSDAWIFRTGADGNILWNLTLGGSQSDSFSKVIATGDGGYITLGNSDSSDGDLPGNQGSNDLWVVKFGPDPLGVDEPRPTDALRIFPNPCREALFVEVPALFTPSRWWLADIHGRQVASGANASPRLYIPVDHLAPGTYTVVLEADGTRRTSTFVKE